MPPDRERAVDDARRARIAATIRADVRALAHYPVALADGWIKLDAMENPYGLPERRARRRSRRQSRRSRSTATRTATRARSSALRVARKPGLDDVSA